MQLYANSSSERKQGTISSHKSLTCGENLTWTKVAMKIPFQESLTTGRVLAKAESLHESDGNTGSSNGIGDVHRRPSHSTRMNCVEPTRRKSPLGRWGQLADSRRQGSQ
eukprot:TRINITY_DN32528_c0_g1_i1.p2 TRINITY_DN32528_c0_g1~~TRINITY_DN32528_c0_g1_i1.p2  ORF type:complete len:109 (+),score=4.37 TRINITY_DN32528_c0_g1_i1:96-422(+)